MGWLKNWLTSSNPIVGQSPQHLKNTHFIQLLQNKRLKPGEVITSFDVKVLITSVPVVPSIQVVKYFSFKGKFYEQLEAAAMGSPLCPIVANLYMESFEVEALRSAPHPPYLWKRFVDDTFTILQSSQKDGFLEHLNSIDQHIQFTAEDQRSDGATPFLDILVTPRRDGSLSTSVYRKPTHTDLYLQWDSHHTLTSKYSVIGTLQHRAQTICSNPQLLQKEEHLKNALKNCKYPTWALNRIQMKTKKQDNKQVPTNRTSRNNQKKSYIVVPYYSGLSESIKNIGRKFGAQVFCKGGTTIKNLLMAPKDKDPIQKQSGVIYRYQCDRVDCDEEYIGESSRTFGERFKEHLKPPLSHV